MLEVYLVTNFQDILNLEAQAVLDTCCNKEDCALCPSIAKDVRRWNDLADREKIMVAMLLLNKIRKDLVARDR
jgi:hypothetical protein